MVVEGVDVMMGAMVLLHLVMVLQAMHRLHLIVLLLLLIVLLLLLIVHQLLHIVHQLLLIVLLPRSILLLFRLAVVSHPSNPQPAAQSMKHNKSPVLRNNVL